MLQAWYNKQVVFVVFRPGMVTVEGCIEHQRFHESSSEAIHVMQDVFHQRYGKNVSFKKYKIPRKLDFFLAYGGTCHIVVDPEISRMINVKGIFN